MYELLKGSSYELQNAYFYDNSDGFSLSYRYGRKKAKYL